MEVEEEGLVVERAAEETAAREAAKTPAFFISTPRSGIEISRSVDEELFVASSFPFLSLLLYTASCSSEYPRAVVRDQGNKSNRTVRSVPARPAEGAVNAYLGHRGQ